jgi:hypothetical protein
MVIVHSTHAQTTKLWTETDRQYLIDNLRRSYNHVIKETQNLTTNNGLLKKVQTAGR